MAGGRASKLKKKSKQAIATTTATSSTSSKQQQSKQNVPPNKPNSNDTAQNSVITPIQNTNNKSSELFAKSADASDSDDDIICIATKSIDEARMWRPPPNNPEMGQLHYKFIGKPGQMWVNGKIVNQTDSSITVEWGEGTNISPFKTSYTSLKQLLQWKDELSGVELDSKESRRRNTAIPQQEDNMKVVRKKKKSNKLSVGDRVEAKFNGTGSYFPGVIKTVNSGNTYDILYDSDKDGLEQDIDKYLDGKHIRLLGKEEEESSDEETSSEEESDEESSDGEGYDGENYKRDMEEQEEESSSNDEEDNDLLDSDEEIISNEEKKKKDVSKYKQSSLTETFTSNKTKAPQTKKAAPPRTKKGGEGKENESKGGAGKKSPTSSDDTMIESEEERGAVENTMKKASKLSAAPPKAAAKSSTKHKIDYDEDPHPVAKKSTQSKQVATKPTATESTATKPTLADGVKAGCQKCIAEQDSGNKTKAKHDTKCPRWNLRKKSKQSKSNAATTNNNKEEEKKKRHSDTDLTKQASPPKRTRLDNGQHTNKQSSSISNAAGGNAAGDTLGMQNDSTISNNEDESYTAPTNNINIVSIHDKVHNTAQAIAEERHPTIQNFHDNKTVQYNNEAQHVVKSVTNTIFPRIEKVVSEQKTEHLNKLDSDQQAVIRLVSTKTTCPITRDGLNQLVSDIELEKERVSNEYDLHLHNEKERLATTIKGEVLLQETWRPDWSHCISVGLGLALAVVVRR